ncbi:MAG: PmoA family protein, partial [Ktedonobacteraceae bacterium]|nr:PmoA family protein [Ktedonobacteraceae bacterium]
MSMTLTHRLNESLELRYRDTTLFHYIYRSSVPERESPKPYFHPLKTLAGNDLTLFRPHDHLWHTGLAMTSAQLSGQNFWGGPTYVRDRGYAHLSNNGSMQHSEWSELTCDNEQVRCIEQLRWITSEGEHWIDEERHILVREVKPEEGYWCL